MSVVGGGGEYKMCTRGFILSDQKSDVTFVYSHACRTFGIIHATLFAIPQ